MFARTSRRGALSPLVLVVALFTGSLLAVCPTASAVSQQDRTQGGSAQKAAAPRFALTGTKSFDQHTREIELRAKVNRVKPGTVVTFERFEVSDYGVESWQVRASVSLPEDRRITVTVPVYERTDAWYRACSVSKRGVKGCSKTFESKAYIAPEEPEATEPRKPMTPQVQAEWIQAALDKLNAERAEAGVAPLTLDAGSSQEAQAQAQYLYETDEYPPPAPGQSCMGTTRGHYSPSVVENPVVDVDPAYTTVGIGVYWTEAEREDGVYYAVVSIYR